MEKLGGETGVSNPQADKFRNIFRIATIGMIPLTAMMPSVCYSAFNLIVFLLILIRLA